MCGDFYQLRSCSFGVGKNLSLVHVAEVNFGQLQSCSFEVDPEVENGTKGNACTGSSFFSTLELQLQSWQKLLCSMSGLYSFWFNFGASFRVGNTTLNCTRKKPTSKLTPKLDKKLDKRRKSTFKSGTAPELNSRVGKKLEKSWIVRMGSCTH